MWIFSVMLWVEGACLDPRYRLLHAKRGKDYISIHSINQLIDQSNESNGYGPIAQGYTAQYMQAVLGRRSAGHRILFDIKYAEDRSGQTESYLRFWPEGFAIKTVFFVARSKTENGNI